VTTMKRRKKTSRISEIVEQDRKQHGPDLGHRHPVYCFEDLLFLVVTNLLSGVLRPPDIVVGRLTVLFIYLLYESYMENIK